MQYVWVILLFLPSALSQFTGRFRVVVPEAHVFSVSGSDVVLSCSLREEFSPNIINAVDLTVTWSRSDLKGSLVHLYENHKYLNTDQNPSYRGRTAVFKEELKNGNASLKISNVRFTDEGEYRCRVDSTSWWKNKTIKLSVEVVGSEPVITVEKYDSESGKFSLLCESKGWRPEPELQWRNNKGVNVTAETETQPVADLFNVKSRITVEKIDSFFCTVTQRHYEKEGGIDAHTLYEHVPSKAGKIVGITIGVLLLVGVPAGVVFYIYNEKRKKEEEINEEKRKKEEEINEVKSLLNSDRDDRLKHHSLSQRQWEHVEETLLNSEEDLKEFILRKFDPSDRGVEKLKKLIASSEKALLEKCDLTEKSCADLAEVLQSENSKLTELHLSQNTRLKDSGVKKLCNGLKNENCKLKKLWLEDCFLTKESCAYLAEVLKSENSKLIELNLSKNRRLEDSGVNKLCDALKNENCKLEKLWLAECNITDKGFTALASALHPSSPLKELDLSRNELKESEQKLLTELRTKFPKLKVKLDEGSITDEVCAARASENHSSPLKEQDLSGNDLKESEQKLLTGDTFV